jgi:short-subunit dehydrogenase
MSAQDRSAPRALVLGATGLLGRAICVELAGRGYALALVARDAARLRETAAALRAGGALVHPETSIDLRDLVAVAALFQGYADSLFLPDVVVVAHGLHATDAECLQDGGRFRAMVDTNLVAAAFCAEHALALLEARGTGDLIVVSSVSGERGRLRNFRYAATKAGLNAFLDGLRLSARSRAVNVVTLKPGPLASTGAVHGRTLLAALPKKVARVACDAIGSRRSVVFAPWWWRPLMFVVRVLPDWLLRRIDA